MTYGRDREWSDRYLDQVRSIVGPLLLIPAPLERDQKEATDLIILRARDMTIGVRLRRPGFSDRYPDEFTIRAHRDSGAKTELRKIIDGWGDWLFYGHVTAEGLIQPWRVIDLSALRALFIGRPAIIHHPDDRLSGRRDNRDGTSFFWFNAALLPRQVTVAASEQRREAA